MVYGVCVLVVLSGCASSPPHVKDATSQYELARQLLEDGKPKDAIVEFQKVLFNYPESAWADEAQMGLARAYFESGQYILAEAGYNRVLELYPDGPMAPEAAAMIGLSLLARARKPQLDQETTRRAKAHLERFVASYPEHELAREARAGLNECLDRLAEKDFRNGRFYLRIGKPEAARPYFERVLREYPNTRWAAEALLGRAECSRRQGDTDAALKDYRAVIDGHRDSRAATKAREKIDFIEDST